MARKFIIAVDLGGTNLRLALLNSTYRIVSRQSFGTRGFAGKQDLIQEIVSSVSGMFRTRNLSKGDILGIGLGLPGAVDVTSGTVHSLTNIAGWKDVPLERLLRQKFRLPVFLDNDARLMCLAEHRLGAARGARYAVCITLGTGVGAGIITDGKINRGANNVSGEVGHIPLNENGQPCNCGGRGCLETYIGNSRLLARARRAFGREIALEEISRLARRGNRKALVFWAAAGRHLGTALVGVVNLLNPDVIVIGGGVANAGEALFGEVKEVIKSRAMSVQAGHVKILRARFGSDSGLIGAAIMVKDGVGK